MSATIPPDRQGSPTKQRDFDVNKPKQDRPMPSQDDTQDGGQLSDKQSRVPADDDAAVVPED